MILGGYARDLTRRELRGAAARLALRPDAWSPLVRHDASMHDTVVEMSAKRLGVIGVTTEQGELIGIITDGDLRRHIEQGLDHPASAFMTANPKTIGPDTLVGEALALFDEHRITTLFVVDGEKPVGVLHIHDCASAR